MDTLHDVTGLEISNFSTNIELLHIVIKRSRRRCWQSPLYKATEFKLGQILTPSSKLDVPQTEREFVTYTRKITFGVKGNYSELDVKFGDVLKTATDIPKLIECLIGKKVDFKHPFVKQIRKDRHLVLCVIVGVVKLKNDAEITRKTAKVASVDANAETDDEKTKTIQIPGGTSLAYEVREMLISTGGMIELIIVDGGSGGFGANDDVALNTTECSVAVTASRPTGLQRPF